MSHDILSALSGDTGYEDMEDLPFPEQIPELMQLNDALIAEIIGLLSQQPQAAMQG